jgi:hypothetical protein
MDHKSASPNPINLLQIFDMGWQMIWATHLTTDAWIISLI